MMRRGIFGGKKQETKSKGKVFGVSVVEVCQRQGSDIPLIVKEILEYLEERGLKKEGIFRIPGNATVEEQLKAHFDGEPSDVNLENCDDVHAVGCLLKQYLRELPEPLLTFRFYDTFISIQKSNDILYRMTNIRKLISALPACHKNLLSKLCILLRNIAEHSKENKMSIANLAIVLGPNLLRPRHVSTLRMTEDSRHINGIIQSILEEYKYLVLGQGDPPCSDSSETPEGEISLPDGEKQEEGDKLSAMQELAATRKAQVEGAEDQEIVLICPEFDLDNPLGFAMSKLKAAQALAERPFDLHKMKPQQVDEEKKYLKYLLRNYDLAFQHRYGHFPTKREKEPLRPLYERYRTLIDLRNNMNAKCEQENKENANQSFTDLDPKDLENLIAEKKKIQKILLKYQTNFANQNRRPVQFIQDREPLQMEYEQYQQIKKKIAYLQNKKS